MKCPVTRSRHRFFWSPVCIFIMKSPLQPRIFMQTSQEKRDQTSRHKNSNPQSKLLEIERPFKVPVDQLFAAFTTPEALKNWWWPNGLYTDRVEFDFREGGKYFINMKGFDQGGGGMT